MKASWVVVPLTAMMFASCGYDRELLGDVIENVEPADQVVAEPEPEENAPADGYTLPVKPGEIFDELGYWLHRDPWGWVWRPYPEWESILRWGPIAKRYPFVDGSWIMDYTHGWMWVPGRDEWVPLPPPIIICPPPPIIWPSPVPPRETPPENSGGRYKEAPSKPPTPAPDPPKFKEIRKS